MTPLQPPLTRGPAMEIRGIFCNARNTLNRSYLGKSIKMQHVPLHMTYATTATRLLMKWTLVILIHIKHLESMHQSLSGFNTAKSQRVSYPSTFYAQSIPCVVFQAIFR